MKAKITSCNDKYYWYNKCVGKKYDVVSVDKDRYIHVLDGDVERPILFSDAKILNEGKL